MTDKSVCSQKSPGKSIDRRLSIAPMLDWTDRHCRYFLRQISRRVLLYTEMITTGALLHRDPSRFLDFDPAEHPLALQLGGSEPDELATCTRLANDWGYDEINLNVGCPSDRVQSGRFGACLMAEPQLVADCVAAMCEATSHPISVKHRIGIDDMDSYDQLRTFVDTVGQAGCRTFVVHARKAWLQGLSPKENREIPPLQYELVHRLKQDFPALNIVINGGFKTIAQVTRQLTRLDGVMIGREAYQNPWMLAEADTRLFGEPDSGLTRTRVVERMQSYVERQHALGIPVHRVTRHMLGLFQGRRGARAWRRALSNDVHRPGIGPELLGHALSLTH